MFAKKKLITLAALATLAVSAQAQSSVILYGSIDVAVGRVGIVTDSAVMTTKNALVSGGLTESYLGMKGQEDLGGGLKAFFRLESSINLATGDAGIAADGESANYFWDKNAYVGLSGAFGTLKLGRQESLYKLEANAFNPLGASKLSPTAMIFFDHDPQNDSWTNAVGYVSPDINGLTISAQRSLMEDTILPAGGTSKGRDATAVAANYNAGSLGMSALYEDWSTTPNEFTADERWRSILFGASYDFGVVKAFVQYGQSKIDGNVDGFDKEKFLQIGAIVPVTKAGSLHVSYGNYKIDGSDTYAGGKDQMLTVAYNHNLSKRTGLYAGISHHKEKLEPVISDSANTFVVGVRHAF